MADHDTAAIDLSDPDAFAAGPPFAAFDALRRSDPGVHWQDEPHGPGFWSVVRHADVRAVNGDASTFSSARRGAQSVELTDEALAQQRLMLVNMDPPTHTAYRRLVAEGFTARRVRRMEAAVRAVVTDILDRVGERGLRRRHRRGSRAATPGDR